MRASVYEELGRADDARAERAAIKAPRSEAADATPSAPATQPPPGPTSASPAPSSMAINPAVLALLGAALLAIIGLVSGSGGTVAGGFAFGIVSLVWLVVRRS
jgi:hypothetical protein